MKYKILILADVRGWAYHRRAQALKKYTPADFNVTVGYTSDYSPKKGMACIAKEWSEYDLIFQIDYMSHWVGGIFDQFDTDENGIWTQAELNAAGFSYFSGDDGGQQASGDVDASQVASDHSPVVVDFVLPGSEGIPGDLDGDGDVDHGDLGILLADWGCTGGNCPGDCDGDGDTDHADLGVLLANFGTGT